MPTLKATCAEDMPYIQGLEIALTELTDPDEISAASAYIDAKKADLEDNYIGVAQDTYIELQVTVPIATARSNAAQAIGIDNIEYVGMNENVPAKELAPDSNQAMMESGQAAILNITERMATPSTRASTINSVIKNYDRVRARDYARDWSCTNGSLYDHATCHNPEYTFYASNDCTNFVSQCLVYGGLPTDSKWKPYDGQAHISLVLSEYAVAVSPSVPLQLRQLNSLNLWQHLFQNRTLLNEPARSHLSFLDPIPCLRFLQSVLRLQQFLLCLCHKNPSSLSPLPDDFVPQCVGKLDTAKIKFLLY